MPVYRSHGKMTQWLHALAAFVHLGLAIACIVVGITAVDDAKKDNGLDKMPANQQISAGGEVKSEHFFNIAVGAGIFFSITSIAHALFAAYAYSMPDVWERLVKCGSSPLRWVEYSFSAPLMMILIAMLSGIHSAWELAFIFLCVWAGMMFGLVIDLIWFFPHSMQGEKTPQMTGAADKLPLFDVLSNRLPRIMLPGGVELSSYVATLVFNVCFFVSTSLNVAPWVRVFWTFGHLAVGVPAENRALIWVILGLEPVFFGSFALVVAFMAVDRNAKYRVYSEYLYILLSFTAKAFLGLIILFGGLGTTVGAAESSA